MCGIVGLLAKNEKTKEKLGSHIALMLETMSDRGPDSAGIATYQPYSNNNIKLTLYHQDNKSFDWQNFSNELNKEFNVNCQIRKVHSHCVVEVDNKVDILGVKKWIFSNYPYIQITSSGSVIEIYKEIGMPINLIKKFNIKELKGSHAIGHTRMATESAITTEHSHPFSTGDDLCLVHNGSLSNHNRLRESLKKQNIIFQTDNDSEVAAGYLNLKLSQNKDLKSSLEDALVDLDGFYTFVVGTSNGFAIMRDSIACKPAVIAESDNWVAVASEYRAFASLDGIENAKIWEPKPGKVYIWNNKE